MNILRSKFDEVGGPNFISEGRDSDDLDPGLARSENRDQRQCSRFFITYLFTVLYSFILCIYVTAFSLKCDLVTSKYWEEEANRYSNVFMHLY